MPRIYEPETVAAINACSSLDGWSGRNHPRNGETLQLVHDSGAIVDCDQSRAKGLRLCFDIRWAESVEGWGMVSLRDALPYEERSSVTLDWTVAVSRGPAAIAADFARRVEPEALRLWPVFRAHLAEIQAMMQAKRETVQTLAEIYGGSVRNNGAGDGLNLPGYCLNRVQVNGPDSIDCSLHGDLQLFRDIAPAVAAYLKRSSPQD